MTDIKCPYCNSLMEDGFTEIHGTFTGFLLVGFSYQHAYFKAYDKKKDEKVIDNSERIPSLKCKNCDALILKRNGLYSLGNKKNSKNDDLEIDFYNNV